jgi:DNA-binding Xre family transcriptional regulator
MNNKHIGSNFDDFLEEEGILAEVEAVAIKRVIAFQVEQMMQEQNLSKTEMSRRMKTSRAALDRLLDPANQAVTLQTLDRAARALGKRLQISLLDHAKKPFPRLF